MTKRVGKGLVATLGVLVLSAVSACAGDAFKVIVNPSVVGRTVPREVLAKVYLGDARLWGNGEQITAVDLSSTSAVREAFSARVLRMTVDAVMHHWLRRITSSTRLLPPKSKATDEEVIAFVAGERGSVGYVSPGATLPDSVREIAVD